MTMLCKKQRINQLIEDSKHLQYENKNWIGTSITSMKSLFRPKSTSTSKINITDPFGWENENVFYHIKDLADITKIDKKETDNFVRQEKWQSKLLQATQEAQYCNWPTVIKILDVSADMFIGGQW